MKRHYILSTSRISDDIRKIEPENFKKIFLLEVIEENIQNIQL